MSDSPKSFQSLPNVQIVAEPLITEGPQSAIPEPLSFSTEQLEQWKDEVAEWWGAERLRYDHKRTVFLFQQWFAVGKKEAVQMEFNSREEPGKFIEHFLDQIIKDFRSKLHDKQVVRLDIKLTFQTGAHATVMFQGREYQHDVPGHAGIVGQVHYEDGTRQSVFQRFISHPFWQYSHQTRKR